MRPVTKKRLKELGFRSYRAYCLSDHWKQRKAAYWRDHPRRCAIPGCRVRTKLHLHHASYDNLLDERDEDLIPLCSPHHKGLHLHMKHRRVKLELAFDSYVRWLAARHAKIVGMTASSTDERIYIREAAELLDRRIGTLRKWEADGVLPKRLRPKRGDRGWRYWTPAQIEGIRVWIEETERFPGKGLPSYNPTPEKVTKQVAAMRKPRKKDSE